MTPHSPAAAIAWEFWRRHRWGLSAVGYYVIAVAAMKVVAVMRGVQISLDTAETFAAFVMVPLSATLGYVMAVFTFGFSGDLAGRHSVYPTRNFTLPITSRALAGWPMVYGAAAMVVLWFAARLFLLWPPELALPVIWPAVLAAALMAWTQALTWMPYGLPGLRIVVAIVWLVTIDVIVVFALYYEATEPVMVAILTPLLPLAYGVAVVGVARARRGDVPDWRGLFARRVRPASARRNFSRAARAQAWFEWRRHGWSLPVLVAWVVPFELLLLFVAGDAFVLIEVILICALLTPPFMANFAAAPARKSSPERADGYGVTPFMATRPLTSAALVAAKLKTAAWNTAAAWLLMAILVPVGLHLSDTLTLTVDGTRRVVDHIGAPRAVTIAVLAGAALVLSTFKQLVQSLYIGLSGRMWVVRTHAAVSMVFLLAIGPVAVWVVEDPAVQLRLLSALPAILAVLVGLKLCVTGWVAVRLFEAQLVSDRALVVGAAGWMLAVLALYAVLVWLVAAPFFPSHVLLLAAILATPLARLSAAPLAMAWNRHR